MSQKQEGLDIVGAGQLSEIGAIASVFRNACKDLILRELCKYASSDRLNIVQKRGTLIGYRKLYYVRIHHSQLLLYKIIGTVTDYQQEPLSNVIVECFNKVAESDIYLGYRATDAKGQFELTFNHEPVKSTYKVNFMSNEISKAKDTPDIYIVVRDGTKILYKSDVRSNPGELEHFDVLIKQEITFSDPYANSFQKEIGHILANVTAEVVDISEVDPARAAEHMIRIFGNLLNYNVLGVQAHGYPGPQVPRYPKRVSHNHSLPWNEKAVHHTE